MFKLLHIAIALLATATTLQAFQPTAHASGAGAPDPTGAIRSGADGILGYWQRGEGEAIVEIRRHATGYHGVIVACERQPELVGTELLRSLQYDAARGVWRGRVYAPSRGKEYSAEIGTLESGRFVMTVRAAFIKRSVQFNRQPAGDASLARLAGR